MMNDTAYTVEEMIACLEQGARDGLFSGAQLVVVDHGRVCADIATGKTKLLDKAIFQTVLPADVTPHTLFDVASLTKPLVTAALCMVAIDEGVMSLDRKLVTFDGCQFPSWLLGNTIADLLSHHTSLQAWIDLHGAMPCIEDRKNAKRYVLRKISETAPREDGKTWCYSDLGFIILGFILEEIYQETIDKLFEEKIARKIHLESEMLYHPMHRVNQRQIAATCRYSGCVVQGHPDDANVRALSHCAGHAGLFATAGAIARYMDCLLNHTFPVSSEILDVFLNYRNPETPFALGWDRPTGSNSLSARTAKDHVIGHLGFTGCSVWTDLDAAKTVVLLTNRTHINDVPESISNLRRNIHQLAWLL